MPYFLNLLVQIIQNCSRISIWVDTNNRSITFENNK